MEQKHTIPSGTVTPDIGDVITLSSEPNNYTEPVTVTLIQGNKVRTEFDILLSIEKKLEEILNIIKT